MAIKRKIEIILTLLFVFLFSNCTTVNSGEQNKELPHGEEKKTNAKPVFYQRGIASYYGSSFAGRKTANGERYNPNLFTAASKTIPINTFVKVKSLKTGRSVIVRINDRGPYVKRRVIDLSKAAAKKIGMYQKGLVKVNIYLLPSLNKGVK